MSKIMWLSGILLVAAGVALGAISIMSPGQMQIYGLTPEAASVLLVGGVLSLGLGGVIDALGQMGSEVSTQPISVIKTVGQDKVELQDDTPTAIPGFGRRTAQMAGAGAAATAAAATALAETKQAAAASTVTKTSSVADTIAALEQAKSDIKTALGGVESMTSPIEEEQPAHIEPSVEEAVAAEAEAIPAEGELFVIEEKIIRGRPSRILSDDTVESETDEGWMRFENLEHLNEYLDSLEVDEA